MKGAVQLSEAWRAFLERVPEAYGRPRVSLAARAEGYERGVVSIIIPCYNNGQFIAQAIDSALAQSYSDCETIVIDDGSTDSSLGIIKAYGSRIQWRTKANGGAPAARNDGLELARGEYIQFLDGDDLLLPDAVARRLEAMSAECDSVFGDEQSIDEKGELDGEVLRHGPPFWPPADMATYLVMHNLRTPQPLHRRRNVYRAGGFDEVLPRSQEPDFHLRMYFMGQRFKHLPGYVSLRRRHGHADRIGNVKWMTRDPDRYLKLVRHWFTLLEQHCVVPEKEPLWGRLAHLLYSKTSEVFASGFPDLGQRYLEILVRLYPEFRPTGLARLIHRAMGLRRAMGFDRLKARVARSRPAARIRTLLTRRVAP